MTIENRRQLENARVKLKELEELYVQTQHRPVASEHVRELTLHRLGNGSINSRKKFEGVVPTPEPSTIGSAGIAVVMGLGYARRRRKRTAA